jgi:type IV pilus assembly protein PilA
MKKKGFTLIELMIVVAIIGILAMIAIPNFIKFQCRAKQSEAKSNLKALFQAQKSFFAEYDEYNLLDRVGFDPEPGNRYTYCNSPTDCRTCETGIGSGFPRAMCNGAGPVQMECTGARPGFTGADAPNDMFTSCATGNIDNNSDWDAWRMNDANAMVNDDNDCV